MDSSHSRRRYNKLLEDRSHDLKIVIRTLREKKNAGYTVMTIFISNNSNYILAKKKSMVHFW